MRKSGQELTVRVVGINTPEVDGPYRDAECFGEEASAKGKQLLAGKQVWLERDPNQSTQDRYGRDLAFVWINNRTDFGLTMISGGYAYEYTYDEPYPYQREYQAAQSVARSQQRGLWSPTTCDGHR